MIIDINGLHMHVDRRGDGEPLLLLHGGTGIGADWSLVFTNGDPDGYRIIAPDLRGHGRSSNPSKRIHHSPGGARRLRAPRSSRHSAGEGDRHEPRREDAAPYGDAAAHRIEAMVIVSATPYFPAQARAAMAQLVGRHILRGGLERTAAAARPRRRSNPDAARAHARFQGSATTTWRSRHRCWRRSPRAR